MATKAKGNGKVESKAQRPGVQVVLRVLEQTKVLLAKMAHEARTSMNAAACERLATGKWPQAKKEEK